MKVQDFHCHLAKNIVWGCTKKLEKCGLLPWEGGAGSTSIVLKKSPTFLCNFLLAKVLIESVVMKNAEQEC